MKNKRFLLNTFIQIAKFIFILFFEILKIIPVVISKSYKWLVKRLRFSITFKITTVYAIIFSLLLLVINTGICTAAIAYLGISAAEDLKKDHQIVASYLRESKEIPSENIEYLAKLGQVDITIFDEDKKVLYTTALENSEQVFYDQEKNKIHNENYFFSLNPINPGTSYNNTHRISGFVLVLNDAMVWDSQEIYIQISNYLVKETLSVVILAVTLFCLTIMAIITVIIIGWYKSKKMLKPVETMTRTVKNITINALDTRLDVSGSHDELKELAETFNGMLDRIQSSYEQQNQFVSDASHELRTPIAVIQGYTNLLDRWGKNDPAVLEESIEAIKTESTDMKELVEKLLFLARGDKNTQKIDKKEFPLNDLIDEVIKETRLIDHCHEIINLCNHEHISIYADRKLMKEALRIFIDNSIKYTPEVGKIMVSCGSLKSQLVLVIEDTGIGIPEKDLPHIFNRFYRADKSRTKQTGGSGLGLAIAKWIIDKHGGTIKVESKINEGTKVKIYLPK
ncbi:hypothetical protein JCM14036_32480 [Desulfotomaculum defluvii]